MPLSGGHRDALSQKKKVIKGLGLGRKLLYQGHHRAQLGSPEAGAKWATGNAARTLHTTCVSHACTHTHTLTRLSHKPLL